MFYFLLKYIPQMRGEDYYNFYADFSALGIYTFLLPRYILELLNL